MCVRFQPEHVAGQMEAIDDPSSIRQNSIGPDDARDDLIEMVRSIAFCKNPLVPCYVPERADSSRAECILACRKTTRLLSGRRANNRPAGGMLPVEMDDVVFRSGQINSPI